MDLFRPIVDPSRQHPIFRMLLRDEYAAERAVLSSWAVGFRDRDGKFVHEFQLSFEPCFWELYLNAVLSSLDLQPDMSFAAPDFVITGPTPLCIEAAIAAPPQGGKPPIGYSASDIPTDFSDFNVAATLRLCNTLDSKVRRYREYYSSLQHVINKSFVIAIGAFDRPLAHFAASRPLLAALYGHYFDEQATSHDATEVVNYGVYTATKSSGVDIPIGLFCDDTYAEVSAVIYSALATWGKVRALAENPSAPVIFTTLHPKSDSLIPEIRTTRKSEYSEHLLDGAYVVHNPFARHPLPPGLLSHPRIAELRMPSNGEILMDAPDDFLLLRMLMSLHQRGN